MQGQLRYHIRLAQDLHDLNVRAQENIKATNILELILVCVDVRGSNHEINSRKKKERSSSSSTPLSDTKFSRSLPKTLINQTAEISD
jgi:hypothetical protein